MQAEGQTTTQANIALASVRACTPLHNSRNATNALWRRLLEWSKGQAPGQFP